MSNSVQIWGRWYPARQSDGGGFMVIEPTAYGDKSGELKATIVDANLTEDEARARCQEHNEDPKWTAVQ